VVANSLPLQWFSGRDVPSTLVIDLDGEDPSPLATQRSTATSSESGLSGKIIVIDPGHGEVEGGVNDPGALNTFLGKNERDQVRIQANIVKDILESAGAKVRVVENNTGKSLSQIGSEGTGSDAFVSLHLNAFNKTAQGHEVFVDSASGSSIDRELAVAINTELDSALGINNRGVKSQGLGVLRGVPTSVPAVLVESFFIDEVRTNEKLDELLNTSAVAVARGITKFLS
jgi:N-acetylmuramoyl-L-alanine amidase